MAKLLESFALNLVRLRKERNFTQEQLADRVGITRQSIARYEVRIGAPTFETVGDLAKCLRVEETDLTTDPNLLEQLEDREKHAEWRGFEAGARMMLGKFRPDLDAAKELGIMGGRISKEEVGVIEDLAKRDASPLFSAPVLAIARDLEALNDPELLAAIGKTAKDALAIAARKRNAGRTTPKRHA